MVARGMCGEGGHVWQRGAYVAKGGMCGKEGACMAGEHAWQRGRACMVKGVHAWLLGGQAWDTTRYDQ